jgi:hypothetical protein
VISALLLVAQSATCHGISRHGPKANSEACGGWVDLCGRVITTLLSEPRVRNGP